jgi:hypothetical protein
VIIARPGERGKIKDTRQRLDIMHTVQILALTATLTAENES